MSNERDFDRIARAWLDLGPDEAPDRAVAAVLQAVETTPQVRRPWIRPSRRFPIMNCVATLAAIAAALVIAVGGGALLLGRPADDPNVGVPVSPSPSASPSGSIPTAFRHVWLGELRAVVGIDTDRSFLGFTADEVTYLDTLASVASMSAPDRLTLTLKVARNGCEAGDVGTYTVALSPGGTKLNLAAIDEACSARRDAMAGDWLRSDCLDPENFCLGELEAGEYPSFFFTPRLGPDDPWAPDWGALRYTVPDGWAATSDWPERYELEPADWYASNRGDVAREIRGIYVMSRMGAFDHTPTCDAGALESVGRSPDALVAWLEDHPALVPATAQDITIDGRAAQMIDVSLVPGWTAGCPGDPTPRAILFGLDGEGADGRQWGPLEGMKQRYVLFDLDGDTILIAIGSSADRFDEFVADAMTIVESMTFE